MKIKTPITLSVLLLFLALSCRNDLAHLHLGTGNLTVSISVDKSLYLGEYIKDASGRFVGPASSSMTLTYSTGGKDFSTSADVTLSGTGTSFTGTATLSNLPAGVEGTVRVATFDAREAILSEGSETMVLSSGENRTTLTLSVSDSSPYLALAGPAQFLDEVLIPGETLFIKVEDLQGGSAYQMHVHQEVETDSGPQIAVITESGNVIDHQELPTEKGGISFILPQGENSAVICFYNPYNYEIPGLLWVDKPSTYTSVTYDGFNTLMSFGAQGDYAEYFRMDAQSGKVYLTSREFTGGQIANDGIWSSDDKAGSWVNTLPIDGNLMNTEDLIYPAAVTDLVYRNGLYYFSIYHNISDFGEIGTASYNPRLNSVTQMFTSWKSEIPAYSISYELENQKIAKSATHTFLTYFDSRVTDLTLLAQADGSSVTSEVLAPNFTTTASSFDELQICAVDDTLYILGDSTIYSWKAGEGSLKTVLTMEGAIPEMSRYMSLLKDKYIIASNGEFTYIYLIDSNKSYKISDFTENQNRLPDPLIQDLYLVETASENYILSLAMITGEGVFNTKSLILSVYANGGFNLIGEAVIPAADLPLYTYQPAQIVMDEENGIIYVGGIDNYIEGSDYYWHYFTLH